MPPTLDAFCVTLPLPFFSFSFPLFFSSSSHSHLLSLCAVTSEQSHVARQDPESLLHMEKESLKGGWGGGGLYKRFITTVSNPLLHCQGDVIKHTL